MDSTAQTTLSRRERQIMNILYRLRKATANEVLAELDDQPSYSTVRTQLRVLEEKGHVTHEDDGVRFVYIPSVPKEKARSSALRHLTETFFEGSVENVVSALLGGQGKKLSQAELDRLADMIADARKEAKK